MTSTAQRVFDEWGRLVRSGVLPPSYHDGIQSIARAIEAQRRPVYQTGSEARLTPHEMLYAYGAIYKLLRVTLDTTSTEKAKDDVRDAYNYCALLHGALSKRGFTSENGPTTESGTPP